MFPSAAVAVILVAPAVEPPVRIEELKDGYRVTLTRPAAERFRDSLDKTDEKSIAAALKNLATAAREKDEESENAATLEVVAIVLSGQVPQLRKSMQDHIGPNGATIRVWGLKREHVLKTPRPRLRRILEGVTAALPDEAQAAVGGVMTVARTTPLTWKVEPRK